MVKCKFVQIIDECIGCGACASLMPKYWAMNGPKSKLIKANIEEKDFKLAKETHDACPTSAIKIVDEKGKELK